MIQLKNITKHYDTKTIFDHFNLTIEEFELVAIVGNSGSGKSTLLNIMGLLEEIEDGEIIINHQLISKKKDALLLMRYDIGYMFQNNALVDDYTVKENLDIVLKYSRLNKKEKLNAIKQVLSTVGLEGYENRKVYSLSGGEAQRIAFCKLLLKKPKIVLCDEPTGSLDATNTKMMMDLLMEYHHSSGATVVIVTHDLDIAELCERVIHI
ncbi:ABC transporter ATP-binding protein [uncultured Catenibacterium sp.]|uniref:ABC transporter ATP-binding protein n=1 Tax=uncultured Catenibacterium sp. TaxID=286142 RepID=UPI0025FA9524|nr:ABC transporter ATP-binding protein [uncultured Catenibacterium sp.]